MACKKKGQIPKKIKFQTMRLIKIGVSAQTWYRCSEDTVI
jgi:hypothetical protein